MNSWSSFRTKISSLKPELFGVVLLLVLLIALVDGFSFLLSNHLNHELHILLSILLLMVAALGIEENFLFLALIFSFPNQALVFVMAVARGNAGDFFWSLTVQILLVFIVFAFHKKLLSLFIPEATFGNLNRELKEIRQNSQHRILSFSLLGCMKERKRVIAHAYHVLDELFKVDKAVLFLADYEKNMLIPQEQANIPARSITNPLLVSADFWTKNACEPEKGVLNVISGRSSLPSVRQLVPGADLDAVAAMPLSADGKVIGLLAVIKQKAENKAFLEPELFITFSYVLASALENCYIHEKRINQLDSAKKKAQQIENSFGKYVSPAIVKELVANENLAVLGGKKRPVAIMMVDLRGFTALTGVLRIEYLVQMLNSWFQEASTLILSNHGTIDKYMGDGIMVIFGAPIAKPDDVLRAVFTAFRLQEKFYLFQKNLELPQGYTLGLGIAITSGEAVVGNFGSSHRMDFTAIGEVVNLAARLEKVAGHGEIVIDQNTFSQMPVDKFSYTIEKNLKVKGVADQTVYRLTEIKTSHPENNSD